MQQKLFLYIKTILVVVSCILTSCYTLKQGYYQTSILLKRKPLTEVLAEKTESSDRLKKLEIVPRVLEYGRDKYNLNVGNSYAYYIPLQDKYVTWVVQAAYKRELKLKKWWFPLVGEQPYLGFFVKKDAETERDNLIKDGFDTAMGGVEAFSLLGYISDPLYSSIIDNNNTIELIEVLMHECIHRTIYLTNYSSFNENLADFFAKKATEEFILSHPELNLNLKNYIEQYRRNLTAQEKFKKFLLLAKEKLSAFYSDAFTLNSLQNDVEFLAARGRIFDALEKEYKVFMAGTEQNTSYANVFNKERLNNAVILGYSLYEANQEPLQKLLEKNQNNLAKFIHSLQGCLETKIQSESELWTLINQCKGDQ